VESGNQCRDYLVGWKTFEQLERFLAFVFWPGGVRENCQGFFDVIYHYDCSKMIEIIGISESTSELDL
jgi:hypothetical protein